MIYILGFILLVCLCATSKGKLTFKEREFATAIGFFSLIGLLVALFFFGGA